MVRYHPDAGWLQVTACVGPQSANHSTEMHRCVGTQYANHSAEMHPGREHKVQAIEQKCILLGNTERTPLCGNASFSGTQDVNHSAEMQSLGAANASAEAKW